MRRAPYRQGKIPPEFRVYKSRTGSRVPYGKVRCKCGTWYIDRLDNKAVGMCKDCRMEIKKKHLEEVSKNARERLKRLLKERKERLKQLSKEKYAKKEAVCIDCGKTFVTIRDTHSLCKQCRRKYYNQMWYERQRDRPRELPKQRKGGGNFVKTEYPNWDIYLAERQQCIVKSLLKKRKK